MPNACLIITIVAQVIIKLNKSYQSVFK